MTRRLSDQISNTILGVSPDNPQTKTSAIPGSTADTGSSVLEILDFLKFCVPILYNKAL
jgi:hypothetical protein